MKVECGGCHQEEANVYRNSVHGQKAAEGNLDVPTCVTCHGSHYISSIQALRLQGQAIDALLLQDCAKCHADAKLMAKYGLPLDRYSTYEESYHGRGDKFGSTIVARCASCHGSHAILPASDPLSSVNPNNLGKTCGKCHHDVQKVMSKKVHVSAEAMPTLATYNSAIKLFFWILIVAGAIGTVVFIPIILTTKREG